MNESLIPLSLAILCLDREFLSMTKNDSCPVCGGSATFALARVLDRAPIPNPENLEYAHA